MAEIVQRCAENSIKELEYLRQTNLMSEEMIKRIIAMRMNMDTKTSSYSRTVEDFKNYVAHEVMILEFVRRRRDEKKMSEKKSIEISIIKRIQRLYENAIQFFPSDFSLYEGLYEFSRKNNFSSTASQVIENMIKLFSYRPEMWKIAASWYLLNNNHERAFQTLHKGLTNNPKSTLLYDAAIDMELKLATSKVENQENNENEKLFRENRCCEKLKTYISLILRNMNELGFLIVILDKLEKFSFTLQVQNLILEHLFGNFKREEIVWHTLAKRERKGIHFVTDPNEAPRDQNFTKSCIKYCRDKYEQGLALVAPEKRPILWSYCLETFIELNENKQNIRVNLKKENLKELFAKAHSDKCLTDKHYCVWIEMITDKNEARNILKEALETNPSSEELWKLLLKLAITSDRIKEVESVFEEGKSKIKSLELWMIYVRYNLLVSSNEKMTEIFEATLEEPAEICNVFKPKYLQWVAFHEGIEAARFKYKYLAPLQPHCKELHNLMSKLECLELSTSWENWEKVLLLACEQFGREDVSVWADYTKYILRRRPVDIKEKLEKVYRDAKEHLPSLLWEQYKDIYERSMSESM